MQQRTSLQWRLSTLGTIIGAALTLAFALLPLATAQASATAANTGRTSGSVCVIMARAFSNHGNEKVVTATSEKCYSSYSHYLAARHAAGANSPATLNAIGYGCTGLDFNGSCYFFDVPNSCNYVWNSLNSLTNNRLESLEAIPGVCSRAIVYYLPSRSGLSITCYSAEGECTNLGTINRHDESLYIS